MPRPNGVSNEYQSGATAPADRTDREHGGGKTGAIEKGRETATIGGSPDEGRRIAEQRYWDGQLRWQRTTAIAAIGAFLAAGAYAWLAREQVSAMRDTVTQTQKLVEQQIGATRAAEKANDIARQTLETTERAYISIEYPEVTPLRIGETPHFKCILRNTGHRPATRIELGAPLSFGPPWSGKGPRPHSRGDFFPPVEEDAGDILAPDETKTFEMPVKLWVPPEMLKELKLHDPAFQVLDFRKVIAGKQEVSVMIMVGYDDGFGHARTSWKNLRYVPPLGKFVVDSSHES